MRADPFEHDPMRNKEASLDETTATHPGFTITCDACKSQRVYVKTTLGWSDLSGSWGSVDLVCADCDAQVEVVSNG